MTYKTQGIIIGKKDYRDADRLFTLYTFEHGKIQAVAQGTRKIESKLSGNLELLNHCSYTFAKGKKLDRIATVDTHESFEIIKGNLFSLSAALYGIDIFNQLVKWEMRDEALFLLLLDFLESVQKNTRPTAQSMCVDAFLSTLSSQLGYGESVPPLDSDPPSRAYFDLLFREKVVIQAL